MSADKKDDPTGQDGQQQPKPTIIAASEKDRPKDGADKNIDGFHGFGLRSFRALEILLVLAGIAGGVLAIKTWEESEIDKTVEKKLSEPRILRKIAAESRPSLVFDGTGAILYDMGAVQYLKPDDIRIVKRENWGGTLMMPTKLHIGFVRPVSFSPLMTPLTDSATISASHGRGLDWEFTINWTVLSSDASNTNDSDRVFRLELVP